MLQYINQKRGQSTLEYAVLVIVIIGALLSIQVYIKRGVQGRFKQAADDIGEQFSPGNTRVNKTHTVNSYTSEVFKSGASTSRLLNNEITKDVMNASIKNVDQEYWGK